MFNLRPPRNHIAIPVNENEVRQTHFTAEEVLLRDEPIYIMLASHVGSGSTIYGFWKEIEE